MGEIHYGAEHWQANMVGEKKSSVLWSTKPVPPISGRVWFIAQKCLKDPNGRSVMARLLVFGGPVG